MDEITNADIILRYAMNTTTFMMFWGFIDRKSMPDMTYSQRALRSFHMKTFVSAAVMTYLHFQYPPVV